MTVENMPFYLRATLIMIGAVTFIFILYIGQQIFVPLLLSLFLSILLNPIVNFLTRKKVNHIVAIFISVTVMLIVLGGLLAFISVQFSMFASAFPQLKSKFNQIEGSSIQWFANKFQLDGQVIEGWINNSEKEGLRNLSSGLGETLMTVGSALVAIVLIPVYIFLILFYKPLLLEFVRKLFKTEHHKTVVEILESVNIIIRKYLLGLIIEGVIVAALNCIGLLVLGIEYAILLGITGAILNVIPYIGGITAIILPMLIALVTKSVLSSFLVLVVYSVIQFIDNHYLIPYVVASKVKINALISIVVVLVGNLIWGVAGMFLAIPVTALVKITFDHIEPLKPWGFLLGDSLPETVRLPFGKGKKPVL